MNILVSGLKKGNIINKEAISYLYGIASFVLLLTLYAVFLRGAKTDFRFGVLFTKFLYL